MAVILSVSRRTDIPNYYSDWFFNRLKESFLYVKNPMNAHQVSKIDLSPEIVDCIVFWTKNPENMMKRMAELKGYHYYFQFTLTGYEPDIEPKIPDKKHMVEVFTQLSKLIGSEKIVWRYDPILLNSRYTMQYHLDTFRALAETLKGYTKHVVISFVDEYVKNRRNLANLEIRTPTEDEIQELAVEMAQIASDNGMVIESCAEKIDLHQYGIAHGSCIDKQRIEAIIGSEISGSKDKNQRGECGCMESVEVGTYDTCKNGCIYCYANASNKRVMDHAALYDEHSPLLCGVVGNNDVITNRKVKSFHR